VTGKSWLWLHRLRSRRDFLRAAGVTTVGGSAMFLTACGGDDDTAPGKDAAGGRGEASDAAILNSALDLENTAIAAYGAGAALLKGPALEAGELFLEQEREHANGLAQAIKDLGVTPNKPKSAGEYTAMFPKLRNQKDVLEFAVDLENTAVAAYIDALPKLKSRELRGTAAAIITNEAEHITVLLDALGQPAVPDAFVTGDRA